MAIISKIFLSVSDVAANVVTLRFEDNETVADALVKIAGKLKMQLSKEEILGRYILVYKGIPSAKYFLLDTAIENYLTDECLKVKKQTNKKKFAKKTYFLTFICIE